MLGPASRAILRSPAPRQLLRQPTRRLISFAPPAQKSRSWKSSALRWGIAIGGIYYYNTSNVFKDEEEPITFSASYLPTTESESELLPTLDTITTSRRQRLTPSSTLSTSSASMDASAPILSSSSSPSPSPSSSPPTLDPATAQSHDPNSPAALEEEAAGEGAFNPETGEINWDCPCLGGMAHGPCGPAFRDAFSCFVYSEQEPKGVECIDRFRAMQDCFRAHPDVYGAELADDEDDEDDGGAFDELDNGAGPPVAAGAPESSAVLAKGTPAAAVSAQAASGDEPAVQSKAPPVSQAEAPNSPASKPSAKEPLEPRASLPPRLEHSQGTLPPAWNDARSANDKTLE